ncbi:radical SAM/SPASM domain-containing protein [Bacillus bombysepticus]|uniref:Radical SAM/SPASM domain-containing protein n=1 Tax=Bacillus thuringiensis serovar kumamotoensis TaxID=132267 RepID=A0A9X6JJF6_BACUK|nr:radical SAM protein [Bacillus thuringiensis]MEC2872812.1 SPASM domain-containing protein [Bacillus cereus]OTZ67912.1 radical SAM/SPASM domain-containing protein [Bacillus thuringiensis serovar kumamtoensis]
MKKFSDYNLIIPNEGHEKSLLLFNTMNGNTFSIDERIANAIQTNDLSELTKDEIDLLITKGMVFEEEVNELEKYEYEHNMFKYGQEVLSITWLTTWGCNLDCTYCFEGTNKPKTVTSEENLDIFYKFVEKKLKSGTFKVFALILFGGEPMLHYKGIQYLLPKFKSLCKEFNIIFFNSIVTNGLLFTKEKLGFLIEHGLKLAQLTLDGPKEIHDQKRIYSNGKGTYEATIDKLKLFKEYFPNFTPTIRINIDKENSKYIGTLLDDLIEEGLQYCGLDFGIIRDEAHGCNSISSLCYADDELGDLLYGLWNLAKSKGFNISAMPEKKLVYCGLNKEAAYTFTPELDFYKCWEHVGDKTHLFGYLDEDATIQVKNARYYEWMNKNPTKIPECAACEFLPNCGGGCNVNSFNRYGTYDAPGCFKTKGVLEKQLAFTVNNNQL